MLSAHTPFLWRQVVALTLLVAGLSAALAAVPGPALALTLATLAVPFAGVTVVRSLAVCGLASGRCALRGGGKIASHAPLPTYSIFVPLYHEDGMAAQIVAALSMLDYPPDKLEILIILEADDILTRAAFAAVALPAHFRLLLVPPAHPRTKPKALNYALQFAGGDYVVVYDAEDLPAPNQLREAVAAFQTMPDDVACLQARLLIHNARESWLTRHFSLEYMALFDGLLPAYQAFGVPLPLGGTSNHFPRDLLISLGGWDPYNVTEDADLGIRLARKGYRACVLSSETWEEAPRDYRDWLPQRTRWLKGWMQTWLVHTRQPFRTLRDMGPVGFAGFHIVFGGMILAALVHPAMYVLLCWQFASIGPFAAPVDRAGALLTALSAFNLGFGYLSAMLLCAITALRRRQARLLLHIATLPAYWLLVSVAAWRALWQLLVAPFKWEKTRHRARL